MQKVDRLAKRAGSDKHPIEHLLDSLYRAAAEVRKLGLTMEEAGVAPELYHNPLPANNLKTIGLR